VKCRPPENRTPEHDETSTCQPFLERQLAVIHPKVIVCLGNVASQALLGGGEPMSRVRGKWFNWRGAKLLPTYHPAYLLRNPNAKGIVWEDLQKVMAELGLEVPKKRGKKT
jgi:uracil-DNA glycosylase